MDEQGPILVHCHDGSARSGALCLAHLMVRSAQSSSFVAPDVLLAHLREQRSGAVGAFPGYECAVRAVIAALE